MRGEVAVWYNEITQFCKSKMADTAEEQKTNDPVAGLRRYANAPISEAVIEIRVPEVLAKDLQQLRDICTDLKGEFPHQAEIVDFQTEFTAGRKPSELEIETTTKKDPGGFRLFDPKTNRVVGLHVNRFSFSQLAPYEHWNAFSGEAKRFWRIYAEGIEIRATRVGTRYINRINIPYDGASLDLKRYLRTVPELSPDMQQGLEGYFMQLQLPQSDINSMALIQQAIAPSESSNVCSILFDIDVHRCANILGEEAIWRALDELRHRKNQIFEASITDATRKLFE
jgi:uncharacterized protein (TIGR04255 family)